MSSAELKEGASSLCTNEIPLTVTVSVKGAALNPGPVAPVVPRQVAVAHWIVELREGSVVIVSV